MEGVQGALITNKRICIVDSSLKALKNIDINSEFSYNFVFSSYWLGKTLLYTTQNNINYCTVEGESQIIFTFNNPRSVICDALADRISIATYDDQDNIDITTRSVYMLEPLIMGELSYVKNDSDIDLDLINNLLKYLNTPQISKKLIYKLMELNLYNPAWKLIESCPQLSEEDKEEFLNQLQKKKSTFDLIYNVSDKSNNKILESVPSVKLQNSLEDEILAKFSTDWEYNFGINYKDEIDHKNTKDSLDLFGLMEIDQEEILKEIEKERNSEKDSEKFLDIIKYGIENLNKEEQKHEEEKVEFSLNEFSYQVNVIRNDDEKEAMPTVMNDNIERYLGYGSLDITSAVPQQPSDMIGEETQNEDDKYEDALDPEENYENFEEINNLMILYRFDQGLGAKLLDLSDNNNHGNIMVDGTMIEHEKATEYWSKGQLEAGEPLTFEDEWGKR